MDDADAGTSVFVLGSFVVACSAHVRRFPSIGETTTAERLVVEAGGKGFNLAVGCHRLGANVYSIFAVGEDAFAHIAVNAFAQAGFVPTRLKRCARPTGAGVAFVDATGETSLAVHPGANGALDAEDVAEVAGAIAAAAVTLAQFEIADPPIVAAFAEARRHGRTTLLNPSPFRPVPSDMLAATSILVVNEMEAAALARTLDLSTADDALTDAALATLFAQGPHTVVVTRGARGAVAYRRDRAPLVQPAFPIVAMDTLGAGDAFLAALATDLAIGRDLADALRSAAGAGALTALRPGVFAALATREELQAFLSIR